MSLQFRKAERKQAKLRLGLTGPAGSGKTLSALKIAFGLGGKIVLIDSENGSGELYADRGDFDYAKIDPPYTAEKYIGAIADAEAAGYDVIILDSISHLWAGSGGLLDQKELIASQSTSNSFTAWRFVTPLHDKFIDAMLYSQSHIIATMRAKTEYILTEDEKGKTKPEKVGMAPKQREGMDYEFTVVLDLDIHHIANSSKDRTGIFDGKIFIPDEGTGQALMQWLNTGDTAIDYTPPAPELRQVPVANPNLCTICKKNEMEPEYKDSILRETKGIVMCSECFRKWFDEKKKANQKKEAQKQDSVKHPEPAPGTDFEKDPEPESRPADAPEEATAAAPEPPTPKKQRKCSQCGGPATESDLQAAMDFIHQSGAIKILCPKCLTIYKDAQRAGTELSIPWTEADLPQAAPEPAAPAAEEKPEPAGEETGYTCSACGRPISKAEEQLSQIFMGRALCKKCLEGAQK